MKIPARSELCVHRDLQKYTHLSPLPSKDEGPNEIGHTMNIGNLIPIVLRFHI